MTRAQGFAKGDLDTSFPLDDKFLALRSSTDSSTYYGATGVFWHVVAATWREADRKPADRVCPDAPSYIEELVRVGLLDADGSVPRRAFAHSVGRAKANRRAATARQQRNRAQSSRVTVSDNSVTPRDLSVGSGKAISGEVEPETKGVQGETDEAFAVLAAIVLTPNPRMLAFLDEIRSEFNDHDTAWAIAEANRQDSRDRRTLLSRAKGLLIAKRREDDARELAEEAARNAAKRAPVALSVVRPPDTRTPEEIEAEIAAYKALKAEEA